MVDEVTMDFPKSLSGVYNNLVDMNLVSRTHIKVEDQSMPWLIKVNKERCPVCGTVEKSKKDWCDPRPENWYDSNE